MNVSIYVCICIFYVRKYEFMYVCMCIFCVYVFLFCMCVSCIYFFIYNISIPHHLHGRKCRCLLFLCGISFTVYVLLLLFYNKYIAYFTLGLFHRIIKLIVAINLL